MSNPIPNPIADPIGNPIRMPTRARAFSISPSPSNSPSNPNPPTSTGDVGGEGKLIEILTSRGVSPSNARSLVAAHPAERVEQAVAYFDRLKDAGPGLLVMAVREGRAPKRSQLDRQRQYGHDIADWLNEHFPALREPSGNPHPAAVAAVVRLHHLHGRGRLTVGEHGPEIRASVSAFRKRWELS